MTIVTPPGWLQNSGTVNTAQSLRNYVGAALPGSGSLIPRGGVNYSMSAACAVTENSPQAMNVIVGGGLGWVPGSENAFQGGYAFMNDSAVVVAIDASHATLNRIDLIVVRVRDSQYSGASNNVTIEVVTGTPSASPSPPAAPSNSLILAQVLVSATVTVITNADITDRRWPLDGVLVARKVVDETVNNSSVLQNDDKLFFDVNIPNSAWTIEAFLNYNSGTTPDIKFAFTGPSGGSVRWQDIFLRPVAVGFGTSLTASANAIEEGVYATGTLNIGSTIGRVNLQWAQNTANASNTILRAESWLRLRLIR